MRKREAEGEKIEKKNEGKYVGKMWEKRRKKKMKERRQEEKVMTSQDCDVREGKGQNFERRGEI